VRTPLPTESALFCREECNFQTKICLRKGTRSLALHKTKIFPRKGTCSSHKTKNFPQKKNAFLATRKDVESYTQMPGKRILVRYLNFQIFLRKAPQLGASRLRRSPCVPFFRGCTPPFQKSWIRPWKSWRYM
jgi:hypothetical protein